MMLDITSSCFLELYQLGFVFMPIYNKYKMPPKWLNLWLVQDIQKPSLPTSWLTDARMSSKNPFLPRIHIFV